MRRMCQQVPSCVVFPVLTELLTACAHIAGAQDDAHMCLVTYNRHLKTFGDCQDEHTADGIR